VGGVPSVYAGDERALRGVKEDRAGGDDAIRPAFPDGPAHLDPAGLPVQRLHQLLIGVRRRHPWLVRARARPHTVGGGGLSYTLTDPAGDGGALAVALNYADRPGTFGVPVAAWRHEAGPAVIPPGADAVRLPPFGWSVASVP
jgi:cyclomaltodextrinase